MRCVIVEWTRRSRKKGRLIVKSVYILQKCRRAHNLSKVRPYYSLEVLKYINMHGDRSGLDAGCSDC